MNNFEEEMDFLNTNKEIIEKCKDFIEEEDELDQEQLN